MAPVGYVGFPTLKDLLDGFYGSGTWKAMLLDDSFIPDEHTNEFISDVNIAEISGDNYSAGGITLTPVVSFNSLTNRYDITFPQVEVENTTILAHFVAYYQDTGTPATSRIAYINGFGEPVQSTNGTFRANQSSFSIDFPSS